MEAAVEFARVALVISLLCAAGAIAAPKGALPLALRGVAKILGKDAARADAPPSRGARVSPVKRFAAFLLALAAFVAAVL